MTTTTILDTNLVRFFLLGVGTLLPFNVFITAKTYFDATLLRRDDGAAGSTNNTTGGEEGWFTKDSFENAFSFWYTTTNLATLLALNRMRVFDNPNKRVTYDRLTTYPLLACAVCFFATASLALDDTAKGTVVVSFATFNLVLFGIFTGLVQFGSFALAATRERKFSTAVVSGQALSGVLASLDADLLLHLALGCRCRVYDFGSRRKRWPGEGLDLCVPSAIWWGLEVARYALSKLWGLASPPPPLLHGHDSTREVDHAIARLPAPLSRRLKYYRRWVATPVLRLEGCFAPSALDGIDAAIVRALWRGLRFDGDTAEPEAPPPPDGMRIFEASAYVAAASEA